MQRVAQVCQRQLSYLFYRPDTFAVTKPAVSKHWSKLRHIALCRLTFFYRHQITEGRGFAAFLLSLPCQCLVSDSTTPTLPLFSLHPRSVILGSTWTLTPPWERTFSGPCPTVSLSSARYGAFADHWHSRFCSRSSYHSSCLGNAMLAGQST